MIAYVIDCQIFLNMWIFFLVYADGASIFRLERNMIFAGQSFAKPHLTILLALATAGVAHI